MLGVREWHRKSTKSTDDKLRTRDSPVRAKEWLNDVCGGREGLLSCSMQDLCSMM